MTGMPITRYARSGDVHIAYQVIGDGPADVVLVWGGISHVEVMWEHPRMARFFEAISTFSRLILFDKRGTGLSDRVAFTGGLDERMDDVRAVLEAAGSDRAFLVSESEGAALAALFAASAPDRVRGLVFYAPLVRLLTAEDWPCGLDPESFDAYVRLGEQRWGDGTVMSLHAPSSAQEPGTRSFYGRLERMAMSPGGFVQHMRVLSEIDIRSVLPTLTSPTLVLHRRDDASVSVEQGRYLAEQVPGGRITELSGRDHLPSVGDTEAIVAEIEEFTTGARSTVSRAVDRILTTVLFTDIVRSTEHAVRLGDQPWRDLLDRHDSEVERVIDRFGGRPIKTTGDGVLAIFDAPGRAVRCACAISDALLPLGLGMRAGVHTGEVERRGDDIAGIAVNTAARIQALADTSEVLVSNTVVDLIAGSGLEFRDRGEHHLKGVPGAWHLHSVER